MERINSYSIESLFKGLKNLLASLPTDEEKAELVRTLSETRDFLYEVQGLVEAFPTMESSQELRHGMSRLDILADRATQHAPLRKLMGLKGPQVHRTKRSNGVEDVESRAMVLCEQLKNSTSSEIPQLLNESGEPVSVLIEVASKLGLRTRKKERKSELIGRISAHITNERGYAMLRGEDPNLSKEESVPATAV